MAASIYTWEIKNHTVIAPKLDEGKMWIDGHHKKLVSRKQDSEEVEGITLESEGFSGWLDGIISNTDLPALTAWINPLGKVIFVLNGSHITFILSVVKGKSEKEIQDILQGNMPLGDFDRPAATYFDAWKQGYVSVTIELTDSPSGKKAPGAILYASHDDGKNLNALSKKTINQLSKILDVNTYTFSPENMEAEHGTDWLGDASSSGGMNLVHESTSPEKNTLPNWLS